MARVNVDGTRRVLDAAVGSRRRARSCASRAPPCTARGRTTRCRSPRTRRCVRTPGFSPAVQAAEVERLLAEWRDDHPGVVVTTLRTAPVLGPGAERLPSRLLLGRPPLRVRGAAPPVQVVARRRPRRRARARRARTTTPARSTWRPTAGSTTPTARALLPASAGAGTRRASSLERVAGAHAGPAVLGEVPPGVVPYLVHPWVVANERLRALGWAPRHTNEEAPSRDGRRRASGHRRCASPAALASWARCGAGWRLIGVLRRGRRTCSDAGEVLGAPGVPLVVEVAARASSCTP